MQVFTELQVVTDAVTGAARNHDNEPRENDVLVCRGGMTNLHGGGQQEVPSS